MRRILWLAVAMAALVAGIAAIGRPRRMVTRIADPNQPFGGTSTYELAPEGTGTRLTITERGEIYFMARFLFGYTASIEEFLQNLARKAGS